MNWGPYKKAKTSQSTDLDNNLGGDNKRCHYPEGFQRIGLLRGGLSLGPRLTTYAVGFFPSSKKPTGLLGWEKRWRLQFSVDDRSVPCAEVVKMTVRGVYG